MKADLSAADGASGIARFLEARPRHLEFLRYLEAIDLPDSFIGAGFIRNAVWDALHGFTGSPPLNDIDVVYFDPADLDPERDQTIAEQLRSACPDMPWSVKNQARMHERNGDRPYRNTYDAVAHWPETATAVAARLYNGSIEIIAPYGVDDLLNLIVRPTEAFAGKMPLYRERVAAKNWRARWPRLTIS